MAQFPEGLVTISKPNSDLGKQVFFSLSFMRGGSRPALSHLGIYITGSGTKTAALTQKGLMQVRKLFFTIQ